MSKYNNINVVNEQIYIIFIVLHDLHYQSHTVNIKFECNHNHRYFAWLGYIQITGYILSN